MITFVQNSGSDSLEFGFVVGQVLAVPLDLVEFGSRGRCFAF